MSTPAVEEPANAVLSDPAASDWLRAALRDSLTRDPVDALNDALALAGILEDRLRHTFALDASD